MAEEKTEERELEIPKPKKPKRKPTAYTAREIMTRYEEHLKRVKGG